MASGAKSDASDRPLGGFSRVTVGIALLAACLAEAALVIAGYFGHFSFSELAGLHVAVALSVFVVGRLSGDVTIAVFACLAILVMGPAGALGSLLIYPTLKNKVGEIDEANDWYKTLSRAPERKEDLAKNIWQSIDEGRFRENSSSAIADFEQITANGTVAQKQAMLGLISKEYHPSYSKFLKACLRDEEAAVRVSAAAVFSKLRDISRARATSISNDAAFMTQEMAESRGLELAKSALSGLLDAGSADAMRRESLELLLRARPQADAADTIEETICTLLLSQGDIETVRQRLEPLDVSSSSVLRDLKVRALMRSSDYEDVPEVHDRKRPVAINLARARLSQDNRALLSAPSDGSF